ncbi:MAG TPA: hypothetical protein VKJ65_07930, partial [Phycisphaerae bacterium]|nr:hypothetical protein [Phycisphaerae bacterium]
GQFILALGNSARLLVDPSGKANVPPLAQELVMDVHMTSTKMTISYPLYQTSSDFQLSVIQQKLAMILGQIDLFSSSNQTPPITLNSESLTKLIDNAGPTFLFFSVFFGAIPFFLLQVLWCALMIVLVSPMVAIVCREVGMPLRVAYRIGTAVMAPVIAVICLLESLGIVSIENPSTDQWSAFLHLAILLSPVPAAIWAGTIANRLFGKPKKSGQK